MTKQDFSDWKSHPITKAVFNALRYREEQIKEVLVLQAGQNVRDDAEYVGYVKALRDFYRMDFDELEETLE